MLKTSRLFLAHVMPRLRWRHNGHEGVSNHQHHNCLRNRLFECRSNKTSKLRVTGLCPVNSPHKGPVRRKMFPFGDVIVHILPLSLLCCIQYNSIPDRVFSIITLRAYLTRFSQHHQDIFFQLMICATVSLCLSNPPKKVSWLIGLCGWKHSAGCGKVPLW